MIVELGRVAPQLLAHEHGGGAVADDLASRAVEACERLLQALSRLVGETGADMLFARSVVLASTELPWLRVPSHESGAQNREALRLALGAQEPASIASAFVAIMSALVGLLERLIGEGLVIRLLDEVWPSVFALGAKDVP